MLGKREAKLSSLAWRPAIAIMHQCRRVASRLEKAELSDWAWLAESLCHRPTSIAEVVHKQPAFGGDCDAAKPGMGGVVFNLRSSTAAPILWRFPFPDHIQRRVVSFDNPKGDINNSQLELAGAIAQHDVAAQTWDVRHCTIATRNDNSAAVAWSLKGSVSRNDPVAYLLRLFSLHRREFRYSTTIAHLSGDLNRMADDCHGLVQCWRRQHENPAHRPLEQLGHAPIPSRPVQHHNGRLRPPNAIRWLPLFPRRSSTTGSRTREPQRRPRHRTYYRCRRLTRRSPSHPPIRPVGTIFGLSFTRKFRFWGRWGLVKAQAPLVIN